MTTLETDIVIILSAFVLLLVIDKVVCSSINWRARKKQSRKSRSL